LENDLISIGKRFDSHWKTQRVRLGRPAKSNVDYRKDGLNWGGAGLVFLRDVRQRAVMFSVGSVGSITFYTFCMLRKTVSSKIEKS
jgi:hypothetical protein